MSLHHVICAIEHYGPEGHDGGEAIRLEGWYLSTGDRVRMSLLLGGAGGEEHEIKDADRVSDDVFRHYGERFGDRAANARFRLVIEHGYAVADWRRAELHCVFADDTTIRHVVGPSSPSMPDAGGAADVG